MRGTFRALLIEIMARPSVELLFIVGCVAGCSGGITERTVAEAGAASGAVGGASSVSNAGRATGGTATGGTVAIGGGGPMGGVAGEPPACGGAPNPLAVRALSTWEYERSVVALTGTAVTEALPVEPQLDAAFNFSMDVTPVTAELLLGEAEKQGTAARSGELLPCDIAKPVDAACATQLVDQVVGRAFRRPLADAERARYLNLFKTGSSQGDMANGVALVVEATLISPIFLHKIYLGSGGGTGGFPLTAFEVADRLAYFLSGAPPDAALSTAASNGDLLTDAGLEQQALRLIGRPEFGDVFQHFHAQWLGLDQLQQASTPGATAELLASMRTETEHFIDHVLRGERRLPDLLTSHIGFIDAELAPLYGVAPPAQEFAAVELDPLRYFGVLTLPSTLTQFSNPTRRGHFVRQRLLCSPIPPPPAGIDTTIEISPTETRRMAWEQHRTNPACAACHQLMDPIGYAFENFDALGRFQVTDNGLPVDASGQLLQLDDLDRTFVGVGELSALLSDSVTVDQCVAKTWLGYALQRQPEDGDDCAVRQAYARFSQHDFDLGELCVALAMSSQFRFRQGYEVPNIPLPASIVSGAIDTLAARRKLLLDFSLTETQWLAQGVPQEDRAVLERYASALRDLEIKLTQISQPGPLP
jgi:hypothetical protein